MTPSASAMNRTNAKPLSPTATIISCQPSWRISTVEARCPVADAVEGVRERGEADRAADCILGIARLYDDEVRQLGQVAAEREAKRLDARGEEPPQPGLKRQDQRAFDGRAVG
jgi:hypothetical protein